MINTLQLIGCISVLLSIINIFRISIKEPITPMINIGGYLLIIILVWVAEFYYIDELNLNGSSLTSIFIIIQVILFIIALFKFSKNYKMNSN